MTIISNSEITTFQRCPKRFYFERVHRYVPKDMPLPLRVGNFGHAMMEAGMHALIEKPEDFDHAKDAVNAVLATATDVEEMKIYRHVLAAIAGYIQNGWRPVAIEEEIQVPIDEGLVFGMKPDLVFEFTKGLSRGKQGIMDYKFTGQYWNDREVNMFIQGFKYAAYWNKVKGTDIRHIGICMLNTRAAQNATGTALWLVKWPNVTKQMLENIMAENEYMLRLIKPFYDDPDNSFFPRTTNKMECKLCPFADDACPMDLAGKPIDKILSRNYTHNTYGYEEALEATR